MLLELLGVPQQLFAVEELEEALVELRDVVPPVFCELHRHHDQIELPDGDKVRHDEVYTNTLYIAEFYQCFLKLFNSKELLGNPKQFKKYVNCTYKVF